MRKQRGITLLESLVAIAILAVAVLGALVVQLRTMAETQTTVRRAQAIRLIDDLSERMKSNPDGFGQLAAFHSDWTSTGSADAACDQQWCEPKALAQWDVARWKESVTQGLPLGQATVFDATAPDAEGVRRQLAVMIGWRANERTNAGPDTLTEEVKPFDVETGAAKVQCPAGLICHLAYVQP
ncbi:type IV pilus modification protein PilV [Variovorax sp. J22R133]|uniref:type IV pilus modification protein PilV n=1 Tax=Variovorax brevis TaxID=3053503 RepID=UPI002578670D|nr:type IV pilus modification protein PilV [Variovorax sp. J22R133]MDM0112677.1 type IV pilus modification protein PilV [Variovorax sp. J22R133]